jgi:PAS domain S-box-containing protein
MMAAIDFYAALFDGLPQAILIADDNRRYVAGNAAACAMLRIEPGQLQQCRIEDFAAPELRDQIDQAWTGFLAAGTQSGEYKLVRRDGTDCVVEFSARANFVPGYHLSSFRDITEQRRIELESEERFSFTFERAAVGMAHVSPKGEFLRLNSRFCEFLGYASGELATLTVQDITHPEDIERDLQGIARLIAGDSILHATEKRYRHKDGHFVWGQASISFAGLEQSAEIFHRRGAGYRRS